MGSVRGGGRGEGSFAFVAIGGGGSRGSSVSKFGTVLEMETSADGLGSQPTMLEGRVA